MSARPLSRNPKSFSSSARVVSLMSVWSQTVPRAAPSFSAFLMSHARSWSKSFSTEYRIPVEGCSGAGPGEMSGSGGSGLPRSAMGLALGDELLESVSLGVDAIGDRAGSGAEIRAHVRDLLVDGDAGGGRPWSDRGAQRVPEYLPHLSNIPPHGV